MSDFKSRLKQLYANLTDEPLKKHSIIFDDKDREKLEAEVYKVCLQYCMDIYSFLVNTDPEANLLDYFVKLNNWIEDLKNLIDSDEYLTIEFVDKNYSDLIVHYNNLQDYFNNHRFMIYDIVFTFDELNVLNALLSDANSNYYICFGKHHLYNELILTVSTKTSENNYNIYHAKKELCFTPTIQNTMAAMISNGDITVRSDGIETIYNLKWDYVYFETDNPETVFKLSALIKNKVLALSGKNKRERIIDCISRLVLQHEKGHAEVQYHVLDKHRAAFGETLSIYGDNIAYTLLEFLADIINHQHQFSGAIQLIKDSRDQNQNILFWIYMSDNWFFDTDMDFMYDYSNLICSYLSLFIKDENRLDFSKYNEINNCFINWAEKTFNKLIDELFNVIKDSHYSDDLCKILKDAKLTYSEIATQSELLNKNIIKDPLLLQTINTFFIERRSKVINEFVKLFSHYRNSNRVEFDNLATHILNEIFDLSET